MPFLRCGGNNDEDGEFEFIFRDGRLSLGSVQGNTPVDGGSNGSGGAGGMELEAMLSPRTLL